MLRGGKMMRNKGKEKKVKAADENRIGFGKLMAWNSRSVSITINTLVIGYVVFFCTDMLKLSPITVGIIMMVSRITDAVTDLFAGFIVDGTHTKWGKGRPYEFCVIGVWACTLFLYCCPDNLTTVAKYIWVFVAYFFVQSVFNTLLGASDIVYMVRAFRNQQQYAMLNSMSGIIISIAGLLFNILFPLMMASMGTSAHGWAVMVGIWAVPCVLIGMMRFFFVKEVRNVDSQKQEKLKIRDVGILLKTNHHIYPVALVVFLTTFLANMGMSVYYYTYIIGNVSLMSVGAAATVAVLPVLFVFPKLVSKMKVKDLMILGAVIGMIGFLIQFIANKNFIVFIIGNMISGVGILPFSYLVSLLVIDCANFNEWKKRPRMEGTLNTVSGIAKKAGSAIGAGFSGVMLGLAGYDKTVAVMPDSAMMMIRVLQGLVPAVCYLLTILCLKIYKLDKLMPQINADNAAAEAAEAAAMENGAEALTAGQAVADEEAVKEAVETKNGLEEQ